VAGADGITCAKHTELRGLIDRKVAVGEFTAISDNCDGLKVEQTMTKIETIDITGTDKVKAITTEVESAIRTPRGLMDSLTAFVKNTFDPKGMFMPMWNLVDAEGNCYIYMTPFDGPDSKDAVEMIIRNACTAHNIVMIGFMSETWVASAPASMSEADAKKMVPSEMPNRKECVFFFVEHIEGGGIAGQAMIERDTNGDGILQPYVELTGTRWQGRFSNFFHRPKKGQSVH
jgi:hypothetical protein